MAALGQLVPALLLELLEMAAHRPFKVPLKARALQAVEARVVRVRLIPALPVSLAIMLNTEVEAVLVGSVKT